MPRVTVTPELSETLRRLRQQNKKTSRDLAYHIQKSPAYISRLENGSIQSLDTKDLQAILSYIINEENPTELADKIYKSLTIYYTTQEIQDQLWFKNYDTVICQIPIPGELIDYINNSLTATHTSRQMLLHRINSNESLSAEETNNHSIPFNEWYINPSYSSAESTLKYCIKIRMSEQLLYSILDKTLDSSSYIYLLAIVYYILKIQSFGETIAIPSDTNIELMTKATNVLNGYKFFSIAEKKAELSRAKSEDELSRILTSFDRDNIEIIKDILRFFEIATEHNIVDTNRKLDLFKKNLHWDVGFMLRLISLKYYSLEEISISNRKKLLDDISALIHKYSCFSKNIKQVEDY